MFTAFNNYLDRLFNNIYPDILYFDDDDDEDDIDIIFVDFDIDNLDANNDINGEFSYQRWPTRYCNRILGRIAIKRIVLVDKKLFIL